MKFVNSMSGINIELGENQVNVIVVESPQLFAELISEIKKQINGEEGSFVLSDEEELCRIEKLVEIIIDPWSIDFDSKKIKRKLLQLVKEESDEFFFDKFLETKGAICRYAENVLEKVVFPISYDMNLDTMSLIKYLDIKVEIQSEKLIDNLIEYVKILHDLCKIEVIILVNIKAYLTEKEIFYLYQEALYQKIHLILFESILTSQMEFEKITIIDADKCIIQI